MYHAQTLPGRRPSARSAPLLLAVATLAGLLAGCVSPSSSAIPRPSRSPAQSVPRPPTAAIPPTVPTVQRRGFIAPEIMQARGLEQVIGADARTLERQFGPPRLSVEEGDARKLQFSGEACVLDIYLYPLREGGEPVATHVEARRSSDGREVDRAQCARALARR